MTEKMKTVGQAENKSPEKPKQLSGTGYPYFDFADSLRVAELIHTRGGGACDVDQLAAWLEYKSTGSGTFASRLASARYFGLIGNTHNGRVAITERARAILTPIMPDDAVRGRADAFLNVDLYKKVFEQFRGTTLPPDVGLANLFQQQFKILPERVQQAVRVFKDSANQTGFFTSARDRLIRPTGTAVSTPSSSETANDTRREESQSERRRVYGGSDDGSGVNPSILGLLRKLPQPGDTWTRADQQGFIDALIAVVKFIYPVKDAAKGEGQ